MLLNELFERIPESKQAVLDTALAALHRRVSSKGNQQTIDGYAFDIARSFDIGMNARQLAALYRERYSVDEGYKLQLERDDAVLVLNITDTNTGKRTEVRGKPGYETGGYDPNDKLHMLLDKIGKTANISELINGETVTINPKHPDAERAKSATHRAFNESLDQPYPYRWGVQSEDEWVARAKTESGAILDIRFEYWDGEWDIEFLLDGGYKATAAGDQFRIFATVVKAIKEWWESTSAKGIPVSIIRFSADKLNNQTGKTGSREKLYRRFAQQFANSIGFTVQRRDKISATDFELVNTNYNEHKVNEAEGKIKYNTPNFEYEWEEAERYPEFVKIGKAAWIELAKKGKAITITSAKGINNTDAGNPDSFKSLDTVKQSRALDQLKSGTVEMPIIAVYSDGWKELIGGNTRLTAMLAQNGRATVWVFKVPDEVAELAENFAGRKKGK